MEKVFEAVVRSYQSHTGFLIFSMVVFLPVSVIYGRMLRSQIRGVERSVIPDKASSSADFRSIKRAYNLLIVEGVLIIGHARRKNDAESDLI